MPGPFLISTPGSIDVGQAGPFLIGTDLYTIVQGVPISGAASMFKSTDAGATWTEQDPTHGPTGSNPAITVCTDGSTIYAVYSVAGFMTVQLFDTVTGLWGLPITTTNAGSVISTSFPVYYRASDNTLIICGPVDAFSPNIQNQRLGYFIFTIIGSSFTAWATCGGTEGIDNSDWIIQSILQGSGTETWFVYEQAPSLSSSVVPYNIVIQSLNGGTLGALTTIDTQSGFSSDSFMLPGASDGSTIVFGWQKTGSGDLTIWKAPTSSMTFVSEVVIGNIIDWTLSVASAGIVLLVNSVVGGNTPLLQYVDPGSGFVAPVTLIVNVDVDAGVQNTASTISPFFGLVFHNGAGGVYFLSPNLAPLPAMKFIAGGVGVVALPSSIGSLCKYATVHRCTKPPVRNILTGGPLVYSVPRGN
jgi:hypothetical protein